MAIPAATTMTQVDTLPGEEIEFSIGDPRWVMRSQSDLYSNRELAVVREYSTNAYDANKQKALEEGVAIPPIEVTLPSMLNPYFKVRDFGYGMTRDILADVYTKFGTSTKRDSNHFNGMLGYGSKSAVAYSTQFTVTSIADGIKTVAVITRKPDWSIVMKIVSQVQSSEPSGTEIVVPVHNHEEFRHKAMDFYKFWMEGSVSVDGKFPEQAVGEKIAEGFYASPDWNTSYVVMGNVPYRIENPAALFWNTGVKQIHFVAYIDNGQVEFTPSREDLKYTDMTKNTLKGVITSFTTEIKDKAQGEIDNATTHAEAYKAWKKWSDMLGESLFSNLEFKGEKFKSRFDVDAYQYRYGTRGGSRNVKTWNVESSSNTLFILDNPAGDPSSSKKAKAMEYKALKGLNNISYVLFVRASDIDCVWVDKSGDNFVTWENLVKAVPKPVRVPRTYAGRTKQFKGSFDMYKSTGYVSEQEIPEDYKTTEYFWMGPGERRAGDYNVQGIIRSLPGKTDKITVVMVGANRLAKFKRDYPFIKEFLPYAKSKIVKDGGSLLSAESKEIMAVSYEDKCWLESFKVDKIDDPEIKRLITLAKGTPDKVDYDRNVSLAQYLKLWYDVKKYEAKKEKQVLKMYPLLEHLSYYRMPADVYVYMNAKYKESRKDKK